MKMRYSCRASLFQPNREYELQPDRLVLRQSSGPNKNIPFSDISRITVFKERQFGSSRSYWATTIHCQGRSIRLTSAHRVGFARLEDRTERYIPFIKTFERNALAANPGIVFTNDEYREALVTKICGFLASWITRILGLITRRQAASICGATLRLIGPLLRGNRHADRQLHAAFPELGLTDVRRIAQGMWDNIGRTVGEYPHARELMNFSADTPEAGQVFMDERTAKALRHLSADTQGALMFAAHLGNWEIPAMAARTAGRKIALVYKRQPSRVITRHLIDFRSKFAARLIEAGPAAPREMVRLLRDGWLVGMLIDQHMAGGIKVDFFGHSCLVNPMLALLTRRRECPVYGARAVRQDDQRHRFELVGPLEFPRDSTGKIDVQSTMQKVITLIESWIRENPQQWMWAHKLIS